MKVFQNFNGKFQIQAFGNSELTNSVSACIELTHFQVMDMLPVFTGEDSELPFDFLSSRFDLDAYAVAYGSDNAAKLFHELEAHGIEVSGHLAGILKTPFKPMYVVEPQNGETAEEAERRVLDMCLNEIGITSVRAYNVLCRAVWDTPTIGRELANPKKLHEITVKDVLYCIPNIHTLRGCGKKTASEIIEVFHKAGLVIPRWEAGLETNIEVK